MKKIGILLTNTGTPSAPTEKAVRRYLREFLSDKRIVQLPRIIWLPILYGLILPFRSGRSAKLYQNIWTPQGSPMRFIMQNLAAQLEKQSNLIVEVGMNYDEPSIKNALEKLQQKEIDQLIVLPLFPQYSHTTTASTYDRVERALKTCRNKPEVYSIKTYATSPDYIQALAQSVKHHWEKHGQSQQLLISFHGIPERFVATGDPYATECEQTAQLLADALQLPKEKWTLCYQSQFGYDKWLKPSTQQLFIDLPKQHIKNIDVICPGFAIDCLETLEEIAIKGKEQFLEAGGESLNYIPALNDSEIQVKLLQKIIENC